MRRCSTAARWLCALSCSTSVFTCSAFARVLTSTASAVDTTMTSSSPTTVVSTGSSERTRLLRLSSITTGPSVALPGVVIEDVPDRAPAADVRPTEIGGNHGGKLGTLHDGVINRFPGGAREGFACQPQKIEVARKARDRRLGGLGHRRLEALDLAE